MLQDIRFGLRILARNPSVTALSTIALALGIGGGTLIFGVVYAVLLKPLPVADPERLVWIWSSLPSRNVPFSFTAYSTYAEWKSGSASFESMSAYVPASATLLAGNEPERLDVLRVNAAFFPMLGVSPAVGRNFLASEDQPGAPKAAILSYALWERRFGRDPGIAGRAINLDGESVTVTGVLPRGFAFGAVESTLPNRTPDLYVPIATGTARGTRGAPSPSAGAYGRLRPGIPIERAQAELDAILRRLESDNAELKGVRAQLWRVRDFTVRDVRLSLLVLLGAVGLVLLIACANVANLLLVRASVREREIALRTALGAERWRIVRQLLTESVVLAACGGAAGLALAAAGTRLVSRYGPERIPYLRDVSLDVRVVAFAFLVTLITGILFGLAPALAAFRARLSETLKQGSLAAGESQGRNRFRGALVVIEVALAMLLTIGASLTGRTLLHLQAAHPGFDAEGVVTASISLPAARYPNPEQRVDFFQRLLDRVRVMPGVHAAGMVSLVPLGGSNTGRSFIIEGQPPPRPEDAPIFWRRVIAPGYFHAMKIPLLRGREFTPQDADSPRIAIINETMARRFWPDADPVGRRFGTGRTAQSWITVIGVVGDVKFTSLTKAPELEFYESYRQAAIADMILTVRTAGDPMRLAPAIRHAVFETDPAQPISRIVPMAQYVSDAVGTPRLTALLLAVFGTTAVLLAGVGIYGVISFNVTRRTREIGVRIALGAAASDVMRAVIGEAVALASAGIAIGIAAALALTSVMQQMLFGVSATEPSAYLAVSAIMIAIAAMAAYVPARRAVRIDPSAAFRCG